MPRGSYCPPGTTGDSQEAGSSQRQIASVHIVPAVNAGLGLVERNVYNDIQNSMCDVRLGNAASLLFLGLPTRLSQKCRFHLTVRVGGWLVARC
ncbi:hypothetical protein Pcinc_034270 [Petrolisthes cinctipes]|uniref:Uncharacterized protein n=1 Tax=Petrolisthes cinctipes TaxID=88211 RepID=A0AAE1JZH7_PETCI|nr:hypothetical protein Pcinc_034270 [Petrolisthes cinctipes]